MSRQVIGSRFAAAVPSCFTECLHRLPYRTQYGIARQKFCKAVLPYGMRRRAASVQASVCGQCQQRLERQFQQWQRIQQQPQQQQLCSVSAVVRARQWRHKAW